MYATPSRSGQDKQASAASESRPGARRIDCGGDDASARYEARPARGGGNREPQSWDRARD